MNSNTVLPANTMAAQPCTSMDSSRTLTSSISSIEITDKNPTYLYDSLGRLICNNDNNVQQNNNKRENRRSWSGYQTLPANFKQHHCHVSRKHGPLTRRQLLSDRTSRSLTNSPVRVWSPGCLGKPHTMNCRRNSAEYAAARKNSLEYTAARKSSLDCNSPRRNSVEFTNGNLDSSQESISNTHPGPLSGCCGANRRTHSESRDEPEDGMRRSHTACAPIASLRSRLKRSMSEGEPRSLLTSRRNSPIRLIPNPQGSSLEEGPRRLVRLRIKCDHASYPHQAVFRKILSATKNKLGKSADIKYKTEGGAGTSQQPTDEEFEKRKQEWQDELEEMSEFLLIKSFNEQAEEGEEQPVDTAFIEDRQGTPYLKACFDVKHFKPEEVDVRIEDGTLVVTAQGVEDKEDRVYRKTLVRQIELPEQVNTDLLHTDISKGGLLTIEMPFVLREQPKPPGPNVFPIVTDPDGKRKLQLDIFIGTEFTDDEIKVESNGTHLFINAGYDAEIGKYGKQVRQREFKREYILPEHLQVDHVESKLDGPKLLVQIYLKEDKPYRCTVTAEDVS